MKVKKTKKSKGGGFQSMGLDPVLMKGILHRGYKLPTPIQRKCIPLALQGCDLVAMARTGSGKTAAFLLPLFNRLLQDTVVKDTRGLILTPTRELAHQTLKFIKDLGKYTKLRSCLVVGGESMEDQFALLHSRPEIIVATPGRFLHLLIEMQLCLSKLEVLILDEADRLFELGFQEQLNDIIKQIPIKRQTLLFSATMPKALADFTQAGLKDPVLVRLDLETKLSENLQLSFIKVRSEDKLAHLLYLLSIKVKADAPTLVFVATRHHVELLKEILVRNGHCCSYLYGSLDPIGPQIFYFL
jgi:ATP-dependent RNA helicase DDX54/DBP10